MKVNTRVILAECIENGLQHGMLRAHKHTDNPGHNYLIDQVENAIWLEIDERFDFERNLCDEVVKGFDQLEKERKWVCLTEEEMLDIVDTFGMQLASAIEDKVKGKNA